MRERLILWVTAAAVCAACSTDGGGEMDVPIACEPAHAAVSTPEGKSLDGARECSTLFDPVIVGSVLPQARVRVFAVGRRLDLDESESEDAYRRVIGCVMDRASEYFRDDALNVIVFEEYTGFPLLLVGPEAARARANSTLELAAAQLYIERYGSLAKPQEPVAAEQELVYALTYHGWPAFYRTFAAAARSYGVPVMATSLVPIYDPATLEPSRTDIRVTNATLLFDPRGRIVHRWDKVYLVPFEQGIRITPGELASVGACDMGGYRWGVGISLDAFKKDYLEHLNALGVQILVQPDANNSNWADLGGNGFWQPEEWLGSVMYSVQDAFPSIQFNVNPMMTGHYLDVVFDGQTAILAKEGSRIRRDINYVGNARLDAYPLHPDAPFPYMGPFPKGGFLALGPWIWMDPDYPDLCPSAGGACIGLEGVPLVPPPDGGREGIQAVLQSLAFERSNLARPYLETLAFADLP
ncbi:MAG: hypothetical protein HYY13_09280 [Nitrospirae bacterium]|nr:hypothetical protein [Nitrospirota bacterium]